MKMHVWGGKRSIWERGIHTLEKKDHKEDDIIALFTLHLLLVLLIPPDWTEERRVSLSSSSDSFLLLCPGDRKIDGFHYASGTNGGLL